MHINGNSPSPSDFPGSESGIRVSMAPRPYAVTETKITTLGSLGFSATFSDDCNSLINDGYTKTCTVTNKARL
jgi:hypothetical protein